MFLQGYKVACLCGDRNRIVSRQRTAMDDSKIKAELSSYRQSIDNIDAALVGILAEHFRCTNRIGRLKAKYQLPPADPAREKFQVARLRQLAEDAHLNPDFAEDLLNFIIKEVIRHHEQIAADHVAANETAGSKPLNENAPPNTTLGS